MKRSTSVSADRALRVASAVAVFIFSALAFAPARAEDRIGLVMSDAPSGAAVTKVSMRMSPDATEATVPIFIRKTTGSTLFSVTFSATPLRDAAGDVTDVTLAFDRDKRTITADGEIRRLDLTVSGLRTIGSFTSTLYATHGTRTQTLGTLSVDHSLPAGELEIARIDRTRATRSFPGIETRPSLLVTIRNHGNRDLSLSGLVVERFAVDGTSTRGPAIRVTDGTGASTGEGSVLPAGGATTLRVVFEGVKDTGRYAGVLRVSAERALPAVQSFAFDVKQGPVFPALLIAAGVAVSYALRRRFSNGSVARAGLARVVERLLSDVRAARERVGTLERREALALETMERRLIDASDSLERARTATNRTTLTEIDRKIDLFADLIAARRLVRAMKPEDVREPFEAQLLRAFAFLAEATPPGELDARFADFERVAAQIPAAVSQVVRDRFHADVDRLVSPAESSPAVSAALPVRIFERIEAAKRSADEGRFADAHAALGAAQLAFAHALADDFSARLPEPDEPPPGFATGWPRFRASIADGLRGVRRQRRGGAAADAYRKVWQEYATELIARLKTAAARERRQSTGGRKEVLASVVVACGEAADQAAAMDPAAVDTFRGAVESYLGAGPRRSAARLRSALDDARLPHPMTVVATGLKDAEPIARPTPRPLQSLGAVTAQIRRRRFGVALTAGVLSIPAGLALLWAPNETWGTLTDGAAIFGWGFGVHAIAAIADARRVGWTASRGARSASRLEISEESSRAAAATLLPRREASS